MRCMIALFSAATQSYLTAICERKLARMFHVEWLPVLLLWQMGRAEGLGFWQMAAKSQEKLDAAGFEKAYNAMVSQKGDGGRPLGISSSRQKAPLAGAFCIDCLSGPMKPEVSVIPANAGIQSRPWLTAWTPAFAGVTTSCIFGPEQ